MSHKRHVVHALAHRETGIKRTTRTQDFVHGRKRRKTTHTMDTAMKHSDSDRQDGNQDHGHMIPGVDGKLQFGFPTKIITILKYVDLYGLTSTAGGLATQVFSMNSAFDPDVTGIGHQPMYYDRYSAIYNNYRVLGSRIVVEISPTNTVAASGPFIMGINGSFSSASLGTSSVVRMEQNDSVHQMFNQDEGANTLSFAFSPEIKLGRSSADDTVNATTAGSPSFQYYAHVWFSDMNGQTTSAILKAWIEYTVEFYLLKLEPQS